MYHLVINPTNIGVFRLKSPAGAESGYTTQKIFPLIPWTNILHQICFLRAGLKGTINWKCKKAVFGIATDFSKNDSKHPSEMRNYHRNSSLV